MAKKINEFFHLSFSVRRVNRFGPAGFTTHLRRKLSSLGFGVILAFGATAATPRSKAPPHGKLSASTAQGTGHMSKITAVLKDESGATAIEYGPDRRRHLGRDYCNVIGTNLNELCEWRRPRVIGQHAARSYEVPTNCYEVSTNYTPGDAKNFTVCGRFACDYSAI